MKETFDKIRLVIFDVDGVLVNSRNIHFPATSLALSDYGYTYTREEDEMFGTIPTREKLNLLAQRGCIELKDIDGIWNLKDDYACKLFDESILVNRNIKKLFEFIKKNNIFIALGSNARYSFLEKVIDRLQISGLVDYIASAQGMKPKPDPYMYISAMKKFNVSPKQTLIFEDSEIGKQAAYGSKANVYEVGSYDELSLKSLSGCLNTVLSY
tara:strand:+ start:4534 stop:5169 length:636 start_codon:yes stop_codon:yes gene_type:complete